MKDLNTNIEEFLIFNWFIKRNALERKIAKSSLAKNDMFKVENAFKIKNAIFSKFFHSFPADFKSDGGANHNVTFDLAGGVAYREDVISYLERGLCFLVYCQKDLGEFFNDFLDLWKDLFKVLEEITTLIEGSDTEGDTHIEDFVANLLREPAHKQFFSTCALKENIISEDQKGLSEEEQAILYLNTILAPLSGNTKKFLAQQRIRRAEDGYNEVFMPDHLRSQRQDALMGQLLKKAKEREAQGDYSHLIYAKDRIIINLSALKD